MQIREQLEQLIESAINAAGAEGLLSLDGPVQTALERPRDTANGDWASTLALRYAKQAHCAPRDLAQTIIDHLPANQMIQSVEVAGPGFINIRLTPAVFQEVVKEIRLQGQDFGRGLAKSDAGRINLEYVSANPTGPMHVGHGRWAALGDAMARLMRHAGYELSEEFYINDHGVQMDVFATSIEVRYQQLLGQEVEMPEACYGGSYVVDIAQGIVDSDGDKWLSVPASERHASFRERGYSQMLGLMKETLSAFGVHFDTWFSERDLYKADEKGQTAVKRALQAMNEKGYLYEKDGATWFRSTAFGDSKDRVLIKANGEMTYFMSDMAYHHNKLERGYTHLIDIWGADHHGYIKRCEAMLEAWGNPGALEVVLGQLVNLYRDGEVVRMSKRTGEMVTFSELIEEVGKDATRFLMLSRSSDQPIDFDIELAKKKDASNPVYYVQYAHARICSLLWRAASSLGTIEKSALESYSIDELASRLLSQDLDLSSLNADAELALMRKMAEFPEFIEQAARDRAPFRLTHYTQELAALFHQFYTECRVIGEEEKLCLARLALADATRKLLALSLSLLGVSAPEKM